MYSMSNVTEKEIYNYINKRKTSTLIIYPPPENNMIVPKTFALLVLSSRIIQSGLDPVAT